MGQILLFILLLFLNIEASQPFCKCVGMDNKTQTDYILRSLEMADVVMYGKVVRLNDREMAQKLGLKFQSPEPLGYFPKITVLKLLKGREFVDTTTELQLNQELDDCAIGFKPDGNYLIFGTLNKNGQLYTSACWPTQEIRNKGDWKRIKAQLIN